MRRRIFLLALVATFIARTAMAQSAPWAPERLTAGWVFTPSMVLGVLHDSNVTLLAVNEPIRSEVVGLLNPRGELDFNGRRTHFNLGYSGALEAYRQFSELNRYEQRGRLDFRYQTGPRVQLYSRASYTRAPTTDRLEFGDGGLPFIDIGSDHLEGNVGFRAQPSPRTHLDGSLNLQSVRFDRETPTEPDEFIRFLQNGHSVTPSLGAMYSVTQHVSFGASWSYRYSKVAGATQEEFSVQNATGEVAWQPAQYTTVRGGLGASYMTSKTTSVDRWGPAYHLGLEHNRGRVELAAGYEHSFMPSIGFGGVNANERVNGSVKVPFAQGRFSVGGNISYGVIEPVDLLGVNFTLHSLYTQGTFGYQITRWLRTEAFVNRSHQTSTARGLVDRTRIGIEFVTAKPVRIQ